MIPVDEIAMRPTISFLSGEDKDKIHNAAFQILSEIGMKILQDEALALLKDAGCSVAEDRMVTIPLKAHRTLFRCTTVKANRSWISAVTAPILVPVPI